MSISFNRNRAQTYYESIIGVTPEELGSKSNIFKQHILTTAEAEGIKKALRMDAIDFFFNGLLSFSEGIDNVFEKRLSWATVKLYYSIYYFVRASMAIKEIALLRCRSMYRLQAKSGNSPFGTNNKKYNTTHEGTINHYKDVFDAYDLLLSNKIDGMDAYEWMMNVREIVNYRCVSFAEPHYLEFWDTIYSYLDNDGLSALLKLLEKDPYVLCFQEEYAVIGIPLKRMQQTADDMSNKGLLTNLGDDRIKFLKNVTKYDKRKITMFNNIYNVK